MEESYRVQQGHTGSILEEASMGGREGRVEVDVFRFEARLGTQGAAGAVLRRQVAAQGTHCEEPGLVDEGVVRR